ncbi:MAG: hypothetical protein QNJ04_14855 [Desulfobacterales bacterium]|nr:hypothetical protein [Desulfobacterales bacterium]
MDDACAALKPLEDLDPDLAACLRAACRRASVKPSEDSCRVIVATLIDCFGREIHFGQAVAEGYEALLVGGAAADSLAEYTAAVMRDGHHGAGRGRATAVFLPPVLLTGSAGLLAAYRQSVAVLLSKGAYLLPAPLEGLRWLLTHGDTSSAAAYLDLLQTVFDRKLSYNRCQYLGNLLPRALKRMPVGRRSGQLRQLGRIAAADLRLLEPFLEGLERGLHLLSGQALGHFVDQALTLVVRHFERARRFVALRSDSGRACCQALQTAVPLPQVMPGLHRYLQARTGRPLRLKPLAALPGVADEALAGGPLAACDGIHIYLSEEIDVFGNREANARLFQILAKFEIALIEYGTYRFDLERMRDLGLIAAPADDDPPAVGDLARFLAGFGHHRLARDLFTMFEHARLRVRLARDYPGLVRKGLPVFQAAYECSRRRLIPPAHLEFAYARLALDLPLERVATATPEEAGFVERLRTAFDAADPDRMPVEGSAGLVKACFQWMADALAIGHRPYRPLAAPFRLSVQIEAYDRAIAPVASRAAAIARRLAARGLKLYPADLRWRLQRNAGHLDGDDLADLLREARESNPVARSQEEIPPLEPVDWQLPGAAGTALDVQDPDDVEAVVWVREWNHLIGDYLHDHVRVRDRRLPMTANGFYASVLERHQGLVRRLKYAFELLRPEGLRLLRQWIEGDDFDYRALLDYVMDRRAGIVPSERLYIKRIKQRRDVAVLLLVDLSRSTSNLVVDSNASVLDVEKEAIVLFSQALEVVGDRYAIAGFSGTGRLGVDYFRIKDFDAALEAGVRGGIGRLQPQRSTRMGAAVRRATQDLLTQDARVHLLIVIGDGFPNDLEYKRGYAIADTRQAIGEARAQRVHTHAITVNIPASPRLDDLYGHVHHTVISDVRELPDKLLWIYTTLTRG